MILLVFSSSPLWMSYLVRSSTHFVSQSQTTIKELRKGAQEAKIELEARKQQR